MQEALIVTNANHSLDALNRKLRQGFRVVLATGMPSSGAESSAYTQYPHALVIIERAENGQKPANNS